MSFSFWIEGVSLPAVSAFGLAGNLLAIYVLRRRKSSLDLNLSFTNLLVCLAVYDSVFLIFANLVYTVPAVLHPRQSELQMMASPYLIPLTNISLTGSVYSVVAITVERYTTLSQTENKKPWKGKVLIMAIVFFSISYNLVKFWELRIDITEPEGGGGQGMVNTDYEVENITQVPKYNINATWLRRHPAYSLNYIVIGNFVVMNLVPVVLLTVLNYLIYSNIKRVTTFHNRICASSHRRDTTMVALLFSIVIVFLTCHFSKLVLNIYEAAQMVQYGTLLHWPTWAENLTRWNHLMLVINSSSNIIIYVAKDFKFRHALYLVMTCRKEDRYKSRRRTSITMITITASPHIGGNEMEDSLAMMPVNCTQLRI